jgi:hypothetical protein
MLKLAMGNHVSVDREPLPLRDVLNSDRITAGREETAKVKFNSKNNKNEYLSSLHVWRFFMETGDLRAVGNSCVSLDSFKEFDKDQVYLALHIYLAEPKHFSPSPSPGSSEHQEPELSVDLILASSREALTPRGLSNCFISSRGDAHSQTGLAYCIYIWHGKESDRFAQATALAKSFELDRALKNERRMLSEYLFCRPEKVPLTSVFSVQHNFKDLEDELLQNHLFHNLFKRGPDYQASSSNAVVNGNPGVTVSWLKTIFSPTLGVDHSLGRSLSSSCIGNANASNTAAVINNASIAVGAHRPGPGDTNNSISNNGSTSGKESDEDNGGSPVVRIKSPPSKPGALSVAKKKSRSSPTLPRPHKTKSKHKSKDKEHKEKGHKKSSKKSSKKTKGSQSSNVPPAVPSLNLGSNSPGSASAPLATVMSKPKIPTLKTPLLAKPGGLSLNISKLTEQRENKDPDEDEFAEPEDKIREKKIKQWDPVCSKITDQLYLGSQTVSQDLVTMKREGITHILNCAGAICPVYHPNEFAYRILYLADGVREDITCLLYDVIEWIDAALKGGGKVFIHCHQGVSRSSAMMIGYLMWKNGKGYQETQLFVKERRPVSRPNSGFMGQLLELEKRLKGGLGGREARLYQITTHSRSDPDLLIAKPATKASVLEQQTKPSAACYVLQSIDCFYIWIGTACNDQHRKVGEQTVRRLQVFEHAVGGVCTIKQGEETPEFTKQLGKIR